MDELFPSPPNQQATNQILAIIVTLAFAVVGGLITGDYININDNLSQVFNPHYLGFIMHFVGKFGKLEEDDFYDDNVNIDEMDEKFAPSEEILSLLESGRDRETSALLTNGH